MLGMNWVNILGPETPPGKVPLIRGVCKNLLKSSSPNVRLLIIFQSPRPLRSTIQIAGVVHELLHYGTGISTNQEGFCKDYIVRGAIDIY